MAATHENSSVVLQGIARHVNCLGEENRNTRKNALLGIQKDTVKRRPPLDSPDLQLVFSEIMKPLLKAFSDPVEKCRELSVEMVLSFMRNVPTCESYLSYIFPVLVQRLGQQEISEPSEEIRLLLIELVMLMVKSSSANIGVYVDDCVRILQRTIVDPFPEVRKESCKCASLLAKSSPQYFYMQSESLVKPLLLTLSHQHSKVRTIVVETIGTVLQFGNGKSVDDAYSHLAQRLFDQTPAVRKAVTKVVGGWLLDLPDRYSYHHKLIPLLLTSLSDEQRDIKELADSLWHDIGLKYERENEDDFKDKLDFQALPPKHYPPGVERPNLGCRVLVNRHLSKILPGLVKDICDWVGETRIKSASLLYWLLINAEEYTTQHIEILLNGLYKASLDDETRVVLDVQRSAELVGYFVKPEIWKKVLLVSLRQSLSSGVVMTLASIVKGCTHDLLLPHQQDLVESILNPDICHTVEAKMHVQILKFCEAMLSVMKEDVKDVGQQIFNMLINTIGMAKEDNIRQNANELLDALAKVQGLRDKTDLFEAHTKPLLDSFGDGINMWTNFSPERMVFDALLIEAGPVVGKHLDDIIPIIVINLHPDKDAELRLKVFSLLSRLIMAAPTTLDSEHHFAEFAVTVLTDVILPNCVWSAGRTAGAIRTTAVSCLWALLQSGALTKEKMEPVIESVITQVISLLEDDNTSTRLLGCRVMTRIFDLMGSSLSMDRLHNMYPELLKRLDDSSDEIRLMMTKTLLAYLDCFEGGYDVSLYRAHLEAIYRGLLVHLDDPEGKIQEAVLAVLKRASELAPEMLIREVESVKHKHRSTTYCDKLIEHASNCRKEA
ncbi:dynein assembly factor 5, axonemal [Aplysia californica]|uniref:Dynein assembly factor 5, axonemal n=1 Tax=Aplysia californica TaxID=6500 RepID=A0ABM0JT08_APLCA|nr:dynein assembly factor 5, axonemal [Aplysia californica]